MKYLKIFEDLNETLYQEIQNMIDNNQFLKGKVKADKSTVYEAGDYILLLGDLSHITDAHVDETIPGSKFEKGVDLKKAIVSLVTNNEPTEMTKGFGTSETKVNNPEEAEKFKWLGLDSKTNVGVENVQKLEPNDEEFKSMNVYTYKDSRGNEFNIKVKEGEGEKTTFLSFIGAKLGTLGDKIVLSVMTAFPGKNGAEVANRNDFMKQGYYFTTMSKEVIENSKGQLSESRIVTKFSDFNETMQFAVLQHAKNLHDEEELRKKKKETSQEVKPEPLPIPDDSHEHSADMDTEVQGETQMETEEGQVEMETEDGESQYESLRHLKSFKRF